MTTAHNKVMGSCHHHLAIQNSSFLFMASPLLLQPAGDRLDTADLLHL